MTRHLGCKGCRIRQCMMKVAAAPAALLTGTSAKKDVRRDARQHPIENQAPTGGLSRRGFLGGLATMGAIGVSRALFPAWMPRMAFRPQTAQTGRPGDVLVVIFLRGGIDGLSAIAPIGDGAHYYDKRPSLALAEPGGSSGTIDLDGYFGLHPSLAPLMDAYQGGDLALVHATGSIDPTRSHFDAMQFMEYGTPGQKTTGTGWVGRHLETTAWASGSPFRAVGMGAMVPASLRGSVTPLALRSIGEFHLRGRADQMARAQATLGSLYGVEAPADLMGAQAKLVFETIDTMQALSAEGYTPDYGAAYPEDDDGFGMGLKQIAQLIKADVGLEVASVDLGGWDTHENQGTHGGFFASHLDTFARGLAAFHADLRDHLGNVTVVTMSEFGRRIEENASAGTDHGHGNFMMVMGGGVNGGRVYADWPTLAPDRLSDGDLAITTDYRDVLSEILSVRVGSTALDRVFPDFTATPRGIVVPR